MIADFTITIHDARKPMAVRVAIHDNVRALRSASARHTKRSGHKDSDFSETLGICHRFHMMGDPLCAIVRLAPPHLGVGFLSHELAHAAVWMWEIEHKFSKKVPIHCGNDEWFCWVLGELMSKAVAQMYKRGVYS